jgi:hypothetical protein
MADINQLITLGIGTPSSIKFFITVGLGIDVPVVQTHLGNVFVNLTPTANITVNLMPTVNINANPTPTENVEIN